jgi:hypothetical protein
LEIIVAVNVKFALSCDVTPCILMHSYQRVGGNWLCTFQGTATLNLKGKPSSGTLGSTGVKMGLIH